MENLERGLMAYHTPASVSPMDTWREKAFDTVGSGKPPWKTW